MPYYNTIEPKLVVIATYESPTFYPSIPPFKPDTLYPEFNGRIPLSAAPNPIYPLCRDLFSKLGLDTDNMNKNCWNPLGGLIKPGDKVLIKPNLVRHIHLTGGDYKAVVTHGSLIRCLLDYIALSLDGKGEIIVGDAPVQSADFDKIIERTGLRQICADISLIWGIQVRLVDFRLWSVKLDANHRMVNGNHLDGDPSGYRAVDLGTRSLLEPISGNSERFRVTCYDSSEMLSHHNKTKNEYLIPQTVLDADVVINMPKLKTHRKVGLTAALKNLVGINGQKDWLPHHRCGAVTDGGDEYPNTYWLKELRISLENKSFPRMGISNLVSRLAIKGVSKISDLIGIDPYFEGSWFGNDTLWRTVLDLNRILMYADRDGIMGETQQRRCLTIVDGIIAGEGEGPMEPDARNCGVLIAGSNPVAVDTVLATMIGFDFRKIPMVFNGYNLSDWRLTDFSPEDIQITSSSDRWRELQVGELGYNFNFLPSSGWLGHIEL